MKAICVLIFFVMTLAGCDRDRAGETVFIQGTGNTGSSVFSGVWPLFNSYFCGGLLFSNIVVNLNGSFFANYGQNYVSALIDSTGRVSGNYYCAYYACAGQIQGTCTSAYNCYGQVFGCGVISPFEMVR